ncbi:MAG TPA: T9SS type A sorting domain-containing protein, partial [Bacteroidia bacterium]|nr:T9SS type A sorting domain-containing protein [Bacteroidia bacterium]
SNSQFPYSGITVENNGRLTLQHVNGLYNGTDNACISSTGNMNYFLAPGSIVEYNGKNSQALTGIGTGMATSGNHKYGKLEINFQGLSNIKNIFLTSSNVFVRTALLLTNGELKLNNNTLTVESGLPTSISRTAGYIKSETTFAYNQSFLKWMNISNGTYIFPFGVSSNEYIPFSFTPVSGFGNVAISTRATGTDNLPYPSGGSLPAVTEIKRSGVDISKSSVIDRWFDIIATGLKANVIVSYRGIENTTHDSNADATFSIQSWDGTNWSRSMGAANGVKTGIGTVSADNVSSFNHWMISTTTEGTPSNDILNFEAVLKNNIVETKWSVSSSNNTGYFSVERSIDQNSFSEIGKVSADENFNYTFNDISPLEGISFYRLKQVNNEGKIAYSENVLVNYQDEAFQDFSIISIFPNPFIDYIKISFTSPGEIITAIMITGPGGQIISSESIQAMKGINTYKLSEKQNLPQGVYVITIKNGGHTLSKKIFKS